MSHDLPDELCDLEAKERHLEDAVMTASGRAYDILTGELDAVREKMGRIKGERLARDGEVWRGFERPKAA